MYRPVASGANFVEDASGRITHLERLSELRRRAVAARLLATPGQKVRIICVCIICKMCFRLGSDFEVVGNLRCSGCMY